jgi:hypothetical protein
MGGRTMCLGCLLEAGHSLSDAHQLMIGETLESAENLRTMNVALPIFEKAGLLEADELPLLRNLFIEIARCHDKWMWFL